MRVYCCQMDVAWEDRETNHAKVAAMLREVDPAPESLVVLPEMFATGFSMNVEATADPPWGGSAVFLEGLARELGVYLVAGIVARGEGPLGRNECVIFSPEGEEVARYAKMYPFTLGGEKDCYEAGAAVVTFDWRGFSVAPFICYDLRFPEAFRAAVRRGATLITVIASWPARRSEHWVALLRARAIENQAHVVGVNRVGRDPFHDYAGRSMIISPSGEILAEAGDEETVISADVDLEELERYRRGLPFLADVRPELFG